ncbi:MAG: hypothetical protein JOY64_20595 [Alphaproteobacteria bacterium]|nr:hypothetical protein [Alphaproteobacteria bacterium]MBV8410039.1 hypothetical protein [Alphaproteobacteria bacterium]
MNVEHLFLYFLACGALTFPLTLSAVFLGRSLLGGGRDGAPGADRGGAFERALTLSLAVWIVGSLVFYALAVQVERRKPCLEQHTNQLTAFCKKELGSTEPDD